MSTMQTLRSCLESFSKVSSGAIPTDIYEAQQWEMAGAHAFLVNGLLNIYEKASSIPHEKKQYFVEYALQWIAAVDHHHHWEETIYYPLYNPKFNTEAIVAEHQLFHAGLNNLKDYLTSCLPSGTNWGYGQTVSSHDVQQLDASHLCSLIDKFVTELTTHLVQEVSYLEPAKIRDSGLTEKELSHIASVSEKHMKSMPPTTFLMYTILHSPKGSAFPPVPDFVRSFLAPYVFYWPKRKLWQFAPESQ